ncbi:hypothetical protein AVEN_192557-1 [Araneus ventricosus]|uniref:Uncharacterized protein n=1 Tax=Araneus ventricosus TaxID=182803 RepID=A0A4Y2LF60_ARAVE|nr:hypothetical protein AVEN_192557-1 [Araneus ventricosus]
MKVSSGIFHQTNLRDFTNEGTFQEERTPPSYPCGGPFFSLITWTSLFPSTLRRVLEVSYSSEGIDHKLRKLTVHQEKWRLVASETSSTARVL